MTHLKRALGWLFMSPFIAVLLLATGVITVFIAFATWCFSNDKNSDFVEF